jgi:molybdopterin molybdotransferase
VAKLNLSVTRFYMTQDYFFKVTTPEQVRDILRTTTKPLSAEKISISDALGRVLADDVDSPVDLPGFERGTMDGFAVRAKDTFGASSGSPAYLNLIGEVKMGENTTIQISQGEAIRVSTGSMMPSGADAVVMVEYTDFLDDQTIEVIRSVAPGDNTVKKDEDLHIGEKMLNKGHVFRPQDIGALAGVGIMSANVVRSPKVAIISSGDEIISPDQTPHIGQIRDINSFSLSALAKQAGGLPIIAGIVKDDYDLLKGTMEKALEDADIALISGGSSVGARDVTIDVIRSLKDAEILVHGVSIKPGKPTIIAKVGDKHVFGLPGNPVSVMVTFELFVGFLIRLLSGAKHPIWEPRYVKAKLNRNVASAPGREDYVCVRLIKSDDGFLAEPVLGKSATISMMVKADGLVKIPLEYEGLEVGTLVDVYIFSS